MKQKHDIINSLIIERGYKSYLEIGYGKGHNFNLINCDIKFAVDPDIGESIDSENLHSLTSDDFFDSNNKKYDIIFIDGLHHAEQVERDIINSWYCLKMGGVILIHDVLPFTEEMQIVPRQQDQWTGDVWRAFQGFKEQYGDKVDVEVLPEKYGIGKIEKSNSPIKEGFINNEMTYDEFSRLSRE